MMRLSMLACIACAVLLAGCGGSSSTSTNSSTVAPGGSSASATTNATSSGSASSGPTTAITAQAVALCKQKISANPTIPANLKPKLNQICDEAGAGHLSAVKKATHDICVAVIKQRVPAAQQAAAAANCPAA